MSEPPRASTGQPGSGPPGDAMIIGNAGLVLLGVWLPRLFERLGLLTRDAAGRPTIAGLEQRSRAVHLLQYLCDGRLGSPEQRLVLNKLLCGLDPAEPVLPGLTPMADDLHVCDSLLAAVIQNWTTLGGSTAAGLRENFLQREGRLEVREGGWQLRVERRAFDVLVDRVPWAFARVHNRWMAGPIMVIW